MDLKAKRKSELDYHKEKRKEDVILAAIEVFKKKGIDNAKMPDIAFEAEVGVATVYRYFKTKADLVIAAGTWLWKEEIADLYRQFCDAGLSRLSGAERIRQLLGGFVGMYREHPGILTFLEHLDNYIVKERLPAEKLAGYKKSIIDIKGLMVGAIKEGIKDGSLREDIDYNEFYITITHGLMSLSQKLLLRGAVLEGDEEVAGERQLKLLIDMAVRYIQRS